MVLSVSLALEESANERIPLKHVLGWGGGMEEVRGVI